MSLSQCSDPKFEVGHLKTRLMAMTHTADAKTLAMDTAKERLNLALSHLKDNISNSYTKSGVLAAYIKFNQEVKSVYKSM